MVSQLVTKLLAQRESRYEVLPGRWLTIRRPAEVEMMGFRHGITIESLKKIVVGWEAFTEADLLGPAVGGSSPVEFDPEVFATWIADKGERFQALTEEVSRLVVEHFKAREVAAKN